MSVPIDDKKDWLSEFGVNLAFIKFMNSYRLPFYLIKWSNRNNKFI